MHDATGRAFLAVIGISLSAVMSGCGASGGGPDLSGTWTGVVPGGCQPALSVDIGESKGVLTGTAKATYGAACGWGTLSYRVSGQHDHPAVTMRFEPMSDLRERVLSGSVRGTDSLVAKLDTIDVTLVRSRGA